MKNLLLSFLCIGLFFQLSAQDFQISDLCDVLPQTADIAVDEAKPAGYMSVVVTDGDWLNGSYLGWCIDTDHEISVTTYNDADIYCSYETLPDGIVEYTENLDLLNWIFNNIAVGQASDCGDNYTFGDIQKAIWMLMDDSPIPPAWLSYIQPYDDCRVTEILTKAGAGGEGYEPGIGDYVGVIFDPGVNLQSIIIPFKITCPEENDDCGECEGQITFLELQYLGSDAGEITVKQKNGKNWVNIYTGDHVTGDIFSFSGVAKHNKMGAKIFLYVDGENETEIHTSCSQEIYAGQTWGDYLIVSGESDEGGPLCEYSSDEECGDCEGGMISLDLEYLGADADNIKVYGKKKHGDDILYFNDAVNNGGIIHFVGTGKDGKMEKDIYIIINDNMNKKTDIHTSCSGDGIYVGQVFDMLYKVVSGISKDGGPLCDNSANGDDCGDCEGQITFLELQYLGSDAGEITVKQKNGKNWVNIYTGDHVTGDIFSFSGVAKHNKMGAKIFLYVDGENETEIHTSCSQEIYAGQTWGDYLIVSGESDEGGPLCELIPPPPNFCATECGECEGQITFLELKYLGSDAGEITVKQKNGKNWVNIYTGDHVTGDIFSFSGVAKHNKMGAKIFLYVDGENETEIHTSCSQDIYAGQTWGDYLIVSGESHEGGPLCENPDKSSQAFINNDNDNASAGVAVYPNPLLHSGTIEFVAAENAVTTVELYNLLGTRVDVLFDSYVAAGSKTVLSIDANKYFTGIYIIVVRNGYSVYKEKISIMN